MVFKIYFYKYKHHTLDKIINGFIQINNKKIFVIYVVQIIYGSFACNLN